MNQDYGYNLNRPVMYVLHRQMKRMPGHPRFSECAKCSTGLLLVNREREKPNKLAADDGCTVCCQRYHYLDIAELRRKLGEE